MYSDVNSMYLSSTEPPAAAEWACLLRPLRGREPEGIWNLLSIVREMFKRRDSNAAPLLEILTDQCLNYEQVLGVGGCFREPGRASNLCFASIQPMAEYNYFNSLRLL